MSSYIVYLGTAQSEQAFREFLETHEGIEAVALKAHAPQTERNSLGEFQRINLADDGAPITPEYLTWRLEQSMTSERISKEDFLADIEKHKSAYRKE